MKKLTLLYSILTVILLVSFVGCKKDVFPPPSIEESKNALPDYYNFINTLKQRGFKFWSFKKYWQNRYNELPDKLIVLRHDIHKQDLNYGYYALTIEKFLLHKNDVATYYVLYGDPTQKDDELLQQKYLDFIHYCDVEKFDVQPHISINTFLIDRKYYPSYLYNKTKDEINAIFNRNYLYNFTDSGIELSIIGTDSLLIENIDNEILTILKDNYNWPLGKFQSVASHGSHEEINLSMLNNQKLMDFKTLYDNEVFEFETYQKRISIKLNYLSDLAENSNPYWRKNPNLLPAGRYQLLMHPKLWAND
jgi:hypothetical protein